MGITWRSHDTYLLPAGLILFSDILILSGRESFREVIIFVSLLFLERGETEYSGTSNEDSSNFTPFVSFFLASKVVRIDI